MPLLKENVKEVVKKMVQDNFRHPETAYNRQDYLNAAQTLFSQGDEEMFSLGNNVHAMLYGLYYMQRNPGEAQALRGNIINSAYTPENLLHSFSDGDANELETFVNEMKEYAAQLQTDLEQGEPAKEEVKEEPQPQQPQKEEPRVDEPSLDSQRVSNEVKQMLFNRIKAYKESTSKENTLESLGRYFTRISNDMFNMRDNPAARRQYLLDDNNALSAALFTEYLHKTENRFDKESIEAVFEEAGVTEQERNFLYQKIKDNDLTLPEEDPVKERLQAEFHPKAAEQEAPANDENEINIEPESGNIHIDVDDIERNPFAPDQESPAVNFADDFAYAEEMDLEIPGPVRRQCPTAQYIIAQSQRQGERSTYDFCKSVLNGAGSAMINDAHDPNRNAMLGAYGLLRQSRANRDQPVNGGLGSKIANWWGKIKENYLLGKMEKQFAEKCGIGKATLDTLTERAGTYLDFNANGVELKDDAQMVAMAAEALANPQPEAELNNDGIGNQEELNIRLDNAFDPDMEKKNEIESEKTEDVKELSEEERQQQTDLENNL